MIATPAGSLTNEMSWLETLLHNSDNTTVKIYSDWVEETTGNQELAESIRGNGGDFPEEWGGFEIHRFNYKSGFACTIRRANSAAKKDILNNLFNSLAHRERVVASWKATRLEKEKYRKHRDEMKKQGAANFVNHYKVGDIFYTSWGYDQTNIDWYQAVKIGLRSVTLQEINDNRTNAQGMEGTTTPIPGALIGKPFLVTVKFNSRGEPYLPFRYGSYRPWDGDSKRWSSYA